MKIITSVFGTKSSKDLKLLEPLVTQINKYNISLSDISDEELREKFNKTRDELKKLIDPKSIKSL